MYLLAAPPSVQTHILVSAVTTAIERSVKLKCKLFSAWKFSISIFIFVLVNVMQRKIKCILKFFRVLSMRSALAQFKLHHRAQLKQIF